MTDQEKEHECVVGLANHYGDQGQLCSAAELAEYAEIVKAEWIVRFNFCPECGRDLRVKQPECQHDWRVTSPPEPDADAWECSKCGLVQIVKTVTHIPTQASRPSP